MENPIEGQAVSIASISSVTTTPATPKPTPAAHESLPDWYSPTVEAAEQAKGGIAPKAAPASARKLSSNTNDLPKLIMFSSEHMSAFQIAHRLGKSVSDVMAEAAAAGINLSAGSTSTSSTPIYSVIKSVNAAKGKGTNIDKTV